MELRLWLTDTQSSLQYRRDIFAAYLPVLRVTYRFDLTWTNFSSKNAKRLVGVS